MTPSQTKPYYLSKVVCVLAFLLWGGRRRRLLSPPSFGSCLLCPSPFWVVLLAPLPPFVLPSSAWCCRSSRKKLEMKLKRCNQLKLNQMRVKLSKVNCSRVVVAFAFLLLDGAAFPSRSGWCCFSSSSCWVVLLPVFPILGGVPGPSSAVFLLFLLVCPFLFSWAVLISLPPFHCF